MAIRAIQQQVSEHLSSLLSTKTTLEDSFRELKQQSWPSLFGRRNSKIIRKMSSSIEALEAIREEDSIAWDHEEAKAKVRKLGQEAHHQIFSSRQLVQTLPRRKPGSLVERLKTIQTELEKFILRYIDRNLNSEDKLDLTDFRLSALYKTEEDAKAQHRNIFRNALNDFLNNDTKYFDNIECPIKKDVYIGLSDSILDSYKGLRQKAFNIYLALRYDLKFMHQDLDEDLQEFINDASRLIKPKGDSRSSEESYKSLIFLSQGLKTNLISDLKYANPSRAKTILKFLLISKLLQEYEMQGALDITRETNQAIYDQALDAYESITNPWNKNSVCTNAENRQLRLNGSNDERETQKLHISMLCNLLIKTIDSSHQPRSYYDIWDMDFDNWKPLQPFIMSESANDYVMLVHKNNIETADADFNINDKFSGLNEVLKKYQFLLISAGISREAIYDLVRNKNDEILKEKIIKKVKTAFIKRSSIKFEDTARFLIFVCTALAEHPFDLKGIFDRKFVKAQIRAMDKTDGKTGFASKLPDLRQWFSRDTK